MSFTNDAASFAMCVSFLAVYKYYAIVFALYCFIFNPSYEIYVCMCVVNVLGQHLHSQNINAHACACACACLCVNVFVSCIVFSCFFFYLLLFCVCCCFDAIIIILVVLLRLGLPTRETEYLRVTKPTKKQTI